MPDQDRQKSNNQIIPETTAAIGHLLLDFLEHDIDPNMKLFLDCPQAAMMTDKKLLPAVTLYLYNVTPDLDEMGGVRTSRIEKIRGDDDQEYYEVARELPLMVRLDYMITVWADKWEQQQAMIACVTQTLENTRTLKGDQLQGSAFNGDEELPLLYTGNLDKDLLSDFRPNMGNSRRPMVHLWTSVPLYQSKVVPIKRVKERDFRIYAPNRFPTQ